MCEASALFAQPHVLYQLAFARSQAGDILQLLLCLQAPQERVVEKNPSCIEVEAKQGTACVAGCELREVPELPRRCCLEEDPLAQM